MKPLCRTISCILSLLLLLPMLLSGGLLSVSAVVAPPLNGSKAALVYCVEADAILYEYQADKILYPAALVKLMTAIVAVEEAEALGMSMDDTVIVSESAVRNTLGLNIALRVGEIVKLGDLITVMLVAGANDAAMVISEVIAGNTEAFIEKMNLKARALKMDDTFYLNPTGIHQDGMTTTARDQLLLATYAIRIPFIADAVRQLRVVIEKTNLSEARYYGTRNYLISDRVVQGYYTSMATGMICGSTDKAGYCSITSARKDGLNYITVLLGGTTSRAVITPERTETDADGNTVTIPAVYKTVYDGLNEARELLKWAESNHSYIKAVDRATPIVEVPVRLAKNVDAVTLLPEAEIEVFVPDDIDREKEITYTYTLVSPTLTAPIKAGTQYGTLTVSYRGEVLGEVALISKSNIEESSWLVILQRIGELAKTPFFLVLLVMFLFAAVFYVISTAVKISKRKQALQKQLERARPTQYLGVKTTESDGTDRRALDTKEKTKGRNGTKR